MNTIVAMQLQIAQDAAEIASLKQSYFDLRDHAMMRMREERLDPECNPAIRSQDVLDRVEAAMSRAADAAGEAYTAAWQERRRADEARKSTAHVASFD